MTSIYSLFPARRKETLFLDHNPIAFFISRLSKSNSCEHRVRFKKRSEVLQNNNFKKTKISMPASGPWSLSRVSILYDTYAFCARLEHLASKFSSLSRKRHQDHRSMPTCYIDFNEMLVKTRNLLPLYPSETSFPLAVTPMLTGFESKGTLPCR
jgi:hypothetical protein